MAGRPAKENKEVKEVAQATIDNSFQEALKKKDEELSEMKTMMMQMQAQMQAMMMGNMQQAQTPKDDEFVSIYKSIPIVSLYDGTLNLSTLPNGGGKIYTFNRFGEVRNIIYNDLREVVVSNFNFAKDGLFYIMDEKVVDEVGLTEYYANIITKEQIEGIIEGDKNTIVDIFNSVPNAQKETVVDIIVRNMAKGKDFDLNKVEAISGAFGKDLKVLAKDLKFAYGDSL